MTTDFNVIPKGNDFEVEERKVYGEPLPSITQQAEDIVETMVANTDPMEHVYNDTNVRTPITLADITNAIQELNAVFIQVTSSLSHEGWSYSITEETNDVYEPTTSKLVTVSLVGNDTAIYGEHYNILNRFWHDSYHRSLELGYSVNEEYVVISAQCNKLRTFKLTALATEVFKIDMIGQVDYYEKYKKYVDNQKMFLLQQLEKNYELVGSSEEFARWAHNKT